MAEDKEAQPETNNGNNENDSKVIEKAANNLEQQQQQEQPKPRQRYNIESRRDALVAIRHLLIENGMSHTEIQLRLGIAPATYFRYLDMLFETEAKSIRGDYFTYQRLLDEVLILNQRFLRRARKLTEIGDDKNVDPEWRIEAHSQAAQLERAVCNMTFHGPSYLKTQGVLPELSSILDTIQDCPLII